MANRLILARRGAPIVLALALVMPASAVQADDGVTYSPSPGFAGSTEQFNACGFQQGETADLILDGSNVAQATADTGCVHISQQTPLDIAPTTHNVSIKGEQSGTEQIGIYLVMPPTVPAQPAPVLPGGSALVMGLFFAPGRAPILLSGGNIPPAPGITDLDGGLLAQVTVLPNTPPGAYPMIIQDNPWLTNPPLVIITVLPQPSDAPPSAQPSGGWTLTATSTLSRDSSNATVKASGVMAAPFTVSNGQLSGQGQLNISVDLKVTDASCHGSSQVPFAVGGTQQDGMFHFVLSGVNASAPVTVTCDNGMSLPFALPAGAGAAPFDIEATDGKAIDLDGSNTFLMVPQTFTGHTHVVVAKA